MKDNGSDSVYTKIYKTEGKRNKIREHHSLRFVFFFVRSFKGICAMHVIQNMQNELQKMKEKKNPRNETNTKNMNSSSSFNEQDRT